VRTRIAGALLLLLALATFQYLRPIPAVQPQPFLPASTRVAGAAPALPWPGNGWAAIGAVGPGVVATSGPEKPAPIASVAKVMTAIVLLDSKPLPQGQQGPSVTVTPDDVTDFATKRDQGQSVVPVAAGEQLTEYQLLEGLLIPSGNNIADLIARWAAGSVPAFVDRMNTRAKSLALKSTIFADTSGFDPRTVSTPEDLVRLGSVAISDPVIADVVSQPQAELPVAGTVYNVDYAIGQGGIGGIKTGSSPQAGACFLFSSPQHGYILVGAVMGLGSLDDAFVATKALIKAAAAVMQVTQVVNKDQPVARYQAPWGSRTDIIATDALAVVEWPGMPLRTRLEAPAAQAPLPPGSSAGALLVTIGDQQSRVPLITADPLFQPGNRWRFLRTDPLL
jgi:D-alanyl-D-alanine carboxypeptidase (penicillin-binding protein 5/6)